jgi:hypothetical protein
LTNCPLSDLPHNVYLVKKVQLNGCMLLVVGRLEVLL